jgi:hypothetical protein
MLFFRIILLLGTLLQQTPGNMCFAAYSATNKYIIRIPSGTITSSPLILDKNLSGFVMPGAISPDGRRVAQIVLAEKKGPDDRWDYRPALPIQLSVQALQNPFVPAQLEHINHAFISSNIEVSWSPDSQWLAYRWQTPSNEAYIALADANGKTIKQAQRDIKPHEQLQFDKWSPDSKFFTVLRYDYHNPETKYTTYDISFWSVPDLRNASPEYQGYIPEDSCETFSAVSDVYCVNWASVGHQPVIVTQSKNERNLLLISLDSSSIKSFSIPPIPGKVVYEGKTYVAWSSNGEYIAVSSGVHIDVEPDKNYQDKSDSLYASALHIFGVDGTRQMNIDQNAVGTVPSEGPDVIQWKWSTDGKTLYYIRYDTSKQSTFEAIGYNVDTKQKQILLSFSSVNVYIEFYPSPDNKSVGILSEQNVPRTIFYWVDSNGKLIQKMDFDLWPGKVSFAWSTTTPSYLALTETMPEETLSSVAGKFSIKVYQSNGSLLMKRLFDFVGSERQQPAWVTCP